MLASYAIDNQISVTFTFSALATKELFSTKGIETKILIAPVVASESANNAKNEILSIFENSDSDYLMFVDSKMGWDVNRAFAAIDTGLDISAFVAPTIVKDATVGFLLEPEYDQYGNFIENNHMFLKTKSVASDLLIIKKELVKTLFNNNPNLRYKKKIRDLDVTIFNFFADEIVANQFVSADDVFCKYVKESGFDIWVDPAGAVFSSALRTTLKETMDNTDQQGSSAHKIDDTVAEAIIKNITEQ